MAGGARGKAGSAEAVDGVEHAVEDLDLPVQAGDFQDFTVGRIRGGQLDASPQLDEVVASIQNRRESLAVERFGTIEIEYCVAALKGDHEGLEALRLISAQLLGSVDNDHFAEDFSGEVHGGQWLVAR